MNRLIIAALAVGLCLSARSEGITQQNDADKRAEARRVLERALQAAAAIPVTPPRPQYFGPHPFPKTDALHEIAVVQARAGDIAGARKTLESIGMDRVPSTWLTFLAEAQLAAGDRKSARGTFIQAAQGPFAHFRTGGGGYDMVPAAFLGEDQVHEIRDIVKVQTSMGDRAGAILTLRSAVERFSDEQRIFLWREIAPVQAAVGDRAAATKTVQQALRRRLAETQSAAGKGHHLMSAAAMLKKIGDLSGARQTYRQAYEILAPLEDEDEPFLAIVAVAQAHAGDRAGAVRLLRQAVQSVATREKGEARNLLLSELGHAQSEIGDFAGACKTLALTELRLYEGLAQDIKTEMLMRGHVVEARKVPTDTSYSPNYWRAGIYNEVVGDQVTGEFAGRKLDLKGAQRTAADMPVGVFKLRALESIAEAQAANRDKAGAQRTTRQGLRVALSILENTRKVNALPLAEIIKAYDGDTSNSFMGDTRNSNTRDVAQSLESLTKTWLSLSDKTDEDRALLGKVLRETDAVLDLVEADADCRDTIRNAQTILEAATSTPPLGPVADPGDLYLRLTRSEALPSPFERAIALTAVAKGLLDQIPPKTIGAAR
jgi:tetratricopeptide (TPR) repeat protein